jgi:Meiotically up-regulated gene 113
MAIDKQHILDELRRITKVNGGKPPGQNEFKNETGINKYDWFPHYWVRWGDAQEEAGFSRNRFREAFGKDLLIEKLIGLIRRTKYGDKIRFPVEGEMLVEKKRTPDFPHANAFRQKFGGKSQIAAAILEHCRARSGFEDVIAACEEVVKTDTSSAVKEKESRDQGIVGSVYLIKSGRYYKIGRTNALGRRQYELAIQLPEKANIVHEIKTDDPSGIESYWHKRFEAKRGNGEWFELTAEDIKAFRRRKFM